MKLLHLVKGEFIRLVKYKALYFSLAITVIWGIIIALIPSEEARILSPLLILTDLIMMTVLLVAAAYYFEKQEGTLITTLIAPVKISHIVTAKFIVQIIIGLFSAVFISLCNTIFHNININYALLLIYSALLVIFGCAVSYLFIFYNKDFTSLLVNFAFIMLILFIPTILNMMGIIPEKFNYIMFLSPFHACETLIKSTMSPDVSVWDTLLGTALIIIESALLIVFGIAKKFKGYAMRG